MMTPERLEQIRQRAGQATPGPWTWEWVDASMQYLHGPGGEFDHVLTVTPCESCRAHAEELAKAGKEICYTGHPRDHEFIAHARQDIPDLLAEVARLSRELEQAKAEREQLAAAILPDAEKRSQWTVQNISALASAHRDDSLEVDATEQADKLGNSYDYSEVGGELRQRAEAAESRLRRAQEQIECKIASYKYHSSDTLHLMLLDQLRWVLAALQEPQA